MPATMMRSAIFTASSMSWVTRTTVWPRSTHERHSASRISGALLDGPDRVANTEAAIAYCLAHPQWRLSVQTHKYLGIA